MLVRFGITLEKEPAMRKHEHLFQVENKRHLLSNKTDLLRTIWNSLNRGNSSRINLKISHGYIINDDNSDGIMAVTKCCFFSKKKEASVCFCLTQSTRSTITAIRRFPSQYWLNKITDK